MPKGAGRLLNQIKNLIVTNGSGFGPGIDRLQGRLFDIGQFRIVDCKPVG